MSVANFSSSVPGEVEDELKMAANTLVELQKVADKVEERLKDGLDIKDVQDTVKDVEVALVKSGCCGWWSKVGSKKLLTKVPAPVE